MNSFKRFDEDKLPDKDEFFSPLKEYYKAIKIWNVFQIKGLGKYHDLYLKINVVLLADVFEKFIRTFLNYYGLDLCHYFSSPGLSWDAMLKMTKKN